MSQYLSNRTRVAIGHQVFEIPSERVGEVINMLSRLQSIQVAESSPRPNPVYPPNSPQYYQGISLING
jgi:predicted transcriptional regulator